MNEVFALSSGTVAIGDPTMGLVEVAVSLPPGSYRLVRGALRRPASSEERPLVDTETMVVYAMDATVAERFEEVFHRMAETVSYDMSEMLTLHDKLQSEVGETVGFYWVGELSGEWTESTFAFDAERIRPSETT
jgi:hypothetical protein